ncbi:aldo/keto reductase [Nitrososphaera sp.]|uniref:aldo/keto reductase n=1 Tax=Nitrososphaera sp. TaxID=1971748 RepID=UPI0017940836|nr:aldo/keto reductase [Nitrososphaera sp.]NWG36145.1 aldo/keto reductase [Nitrososphaera sp.]
MKYRRLGKSDIRVSEIGFGAWTIALDWWGKKIDDDEAIRMLKKAYDLGINFYETADMYGKGRSEKLIGQAFKDMRNEVVYSTKWGYDLYSAEQIGHNELPQKHDPEFLQFALKQSLERLQTDYIDVYSLHNPKMDAMQNDELFSALDDLVKKGTIKSHGVALGPAIGWKEEGIFAIENRNITCLQTVYNILEQDPGRDLIRSAQENDVGIMVRVPDASGLLTGKVNANTKFDKNDHRSFRKQEFIKEAMQKIDNMKPIADKRGWNITQLAIKFILSQPQISVVLPTMISVEELEMFASISDGNYLSPDESARLTEMYENNFFVKPVAG